MRSMLFVWLLLGTIAVAQMAQPTPAPTPATAPVPDKPSVTTNPTDAVITVKKPCDDAAKKGETCEIVVTREQFEKLSEALQPGMSAPIKIRLANALAKLTAMSQEAEKRGLDKRPQFEENMRFARMQILSQQLTTALQQDAQNVSDAEIEKYYSEKRDTYQEATLQRLYIPASKQITTPKSAPAKPEVKKSEAAEKEETEAREKAAKAAMSKAADSLHARAAKGESFDVLEKEAYLTAGLKGNPPTTKMEKVRPNSLPPAHKSVMELKPGEVSPVISDASGHYIYKLVSKQTLPLESVKAEVKNWIATQKFRDEMEEYSGKSQLNEAYFGIPPKPKPQPGKPAEEEVVDPD